jgi:4-carboxymuconolactone decarboxylase
MEPRHQHALRCMALKDDAYISSVLCIDGRNIEASDLDPKVHALVRLAASLSLGASQVCYQSDVEAAELAGASVDEIVGVLIALAPSVGLPRVVSAAPRIALALGYDIDEALEAIDVRTKCGDGSSPDDKDPSAG